LLDSSRPVCRLYNVADRLSSLRRPSHLESERDGGVEETARDAEKDPGVDGEGETEREGDVEDCQGVGRVRKEGERERGRLVETREERRKRERTVRSVGYSSDRITLSSSRCTSDTRRRDVGNAPSTITKLSVSPILFSSVPLISRKRRQRAKRTSSPPNATMINNIVPVNSPIIAIQWLFTAKLAGP
jgi:hypothetical protein